MAKLKLPGARYSGGAVPFWFVIEESPAGRLHIHGENLDRAHLRGAPDRPGASPCLCSNPKGFEGSGRPMDPDRDGDGTQLRFSPGTPDFRWAGYCLKNVHKARAVRRRYMRQFGSRRRWVAGFEGKAVTASGACGWRH